MCVCVLCRKLCSYDCSLRGSHLDESHCYCRVLCFVPVLGGCIWYVCCYVRKKALLQCLSNYLEGDIGLYGVPLSMYLLGFGMGSMLANFHMCGIMLLLKAILNILVRNSSLRGPMCFGCLMFSLSGQCELLFLLCFIASWT